MLPEYRLAGTSYRLRPLHGPLEQLDSDTVYMAIGRFITEWSRMEHLIIALALHLNKKEASPALHDPDPKMAFKRIVALLRRWLTSNTTARPPAPISPAFFDHLIGYSDTRNFLAHGFLSERCGGLLTFQSITRSGPAGYEVKSLRIELEAVHQGATLIKQATLALIEIANVVFPKGSAEPPRKA